MGVVRWVAPAALREQTNPTPGSETMGGRVPWLGCLAASIITAGGLAAGNR